MIGRPTAAAVGLTQMVNWGISYYAVGVFAPVIAADLGWSLARAHAGFSLALIAMAVSSGAAGRLVAARGRQALAAGSVLLALGLAMLGTSATFPIYAAGWIVAGLGMRLCLYEAAFAALVRAGRTGARRALSQVTLLGGLASTVFWPLGHLLAETLGWRGGLLVYAGLALAVAPLYLTIPSGPAPTPAVLAAAGRAAGPVRPAAAIGFAVLVAASAFLSSGLSAHLIGLLGALGLPVAAAVGLAALPGLAQSGARLAETLAGHRIGPLGLGVLASGVLTAGMAAGLAVTGPGAAALAFVLAYGAGNGVLTVVRGAQPMVLFPLARYAEISGRLVAPSFLAAALAPPAYAAAIEIWGARAAMGLSFGLALATFAAAWALWARIGPAAEPGLPARDPDPARRRTARSPSLWLLATWGQPGMLDGAGSEKDAKSAGRTPQ
ncbi:hypothetical protein BYZ73_06205 [Rhodovulum viride]|uniref:MFS transporter n=1 Tax=Rhodovulum viride TaxID=1231134 RepID=A0ABX9DJM3_9RHOB|nr:MFS transporter [Rhodovulum viride]RAP42343.1 hypothetical protein BYZ73_06205 [Rhodovulum viride]